MARKWPTMVDVAVRAGVSQTLVSFYLNGRQAISAETARRIQAAIDELDYHPNGGARNLRLRRSGLVGVMVPLLTNPSFAIMAEAAQAVLAADGLLTVVCSTGGDPAPGSDYFAALQTARVDGLLAIPGPSIAASIRAVARRGSPVVLMEYGLGAETDDRGMDAAVTDSGAGVRLATEHLLALGHRRIGLLNLGRDSALAPQREAGYRAAFAAHGHDVDEGLLTYQPGTVRAGHEAIVRLMRRPSPPTGVVVTANLQTVGALIAVRELGLAMPGDLSVIGFGHPGFEFWPTVPLTSIVHDARAVGLTAAELLLARLRGAATGPARTVALPTHLDVRASTGPPSS